MSILSNQTVPATVTTELADRANLTNWRAGKAAWIHLMSFSDLCTTTYSSETATGYHVGLRPKPGIIGAQVKKLGELGTTKKVIVQLRAYTDSDLEDMSKCFFIPGMSVRIQFGWSVRGQTTPHTTTETDSRANETMWKTTNSSTANYEGYQGKVTNFIYKINQDSGWDVEIEFITAGGLIAETKVESSNNKCLCTAEKDNKSKQLDNSDLGVALLTAMSSEASVQSILGTVGLGFDHYKLVRYNGNTRNAFGEDDVGFWAGLAVGVTGFAQQTINFFSQLFGGGGGAPDIKETTGTDEIFISVEAFHKLVNYFSLPNNGGNGVFGTIDTREVYLQLPVDETRRYLVSSDPRVCLFPGSVWNATDPAVDSSGQVTGAPMCVTGAGVGGGDKVELNRVLLNTLMLASTLRDMRQQSAADKGINLQAYLKAVYDQVNKAAGYLWSFEIIDASAEPGSVGEPRLQIIDIATQPDIKATFSLPAGDYFREFNLETKLTEAMKSQALYGEVAGKQGASDPCINKFKAFATFGAKNTALPLGAATAKTQGDKINCDSVTPPGGGSGGIQCKTDSRSAFDRFDEAFRNLRMNVLEDNIVAVESTRAAWIAEDSSDTEANCHVALPIDWNFTVDGIGGFRFGQYITHSRIPSGLRTQWNFQVTTVEHNITPNDWTTTVHTIARYKK